MLRSNLPVLCLILCGITAPAVAATFTPDTLQDAPDTVPGDGVCSSSFFGLCSLRAAVMEANASAGADTIQLNGGTYVLSLSNASGDENAAATGDLDVQDDLQILSQAGVLTTIDGGGVDRVFDVLGATDFTISGLIVRNGAAVDPVAGNDSYLGGGLRLGNSGSNLIQFSVIEDNTANAGGGIWTSTASTLIRYSVLRNNHADGGVQITNPEGSALRMDGNASLRIENSSLHGNGLLGSGSGNRGAVSVHTSDLEMFSSTVDGDSDGGISTYNSNVTLGNVTVTANGNVGLQWGNFAGTGVTLFLRNSIVAGNGQDCAIFPQSGASVDVDGHNIDGDGSCGLSTAPADGNQSGFTLDDLLGPLNTMIALPARFPWPNSPPWNAGSPLDTTLGLPDACFRYDQRGVDRSTNGPCDVGAAEAVFLFASGFEDIII